jgi:hypothetical protein
VEVVVSLIDALVVTDEAGLILFRRQDCDFGWVGLLAGGFLVVDALLEDSTDDPTILLLSISISINVCEKPQ